MDGILVAANLQTSAASRGPPPAGAAASEQPAHPARAARVAPALVAVAARSRVSKTLPLGDAGTIDLRLDVLNVLNDSAEEALASDDLSRRDVRQAHRFMDPRRVMLSVRLNLGR